MCANCLETILNIHGELPSVDALMYGQPVYDGGRVQLEMEPFLLQVSLKTATDSETMTLLIEMSSLGLHKP